MKRKGGGGEGCGNRERQGANASTQGVLGRTSTLLPTNPLPYFLPIFVALDSPNLVAKSKQSVISARWIVSICFIAENGGDIQIFYKYKLLTKLKEP